MKLIVQILFMAVGAVFFLTYTIPEYKEVKDLRASVVEYDNALNNAKELEQKRDEILAAYNSISAANKERLMKFLPDIDDEKVTSGSIALILEIDNIASANGITITGVEFSQNGGEKSTDNTSGLPVGNFVPSTLSFSIQTTYNNFLAFTRDLESNLRLVDIKKISFSAPTASRENPNVNPNLFQYSFELQSYWLKN